MNAILQKQKICILVYLLLGNYSYAQSFFEGALSLPAESIPMYTNTNLYSSNTAIQYSSVEAIFGFAGIQFDPNFHIVKNNNLDLQIKGQILYDATYFFKSLSANYESESEYLHYHGGAGLDVGFENFKLSIDYMLGLRMIKYESYTDATEDTSAFTEGGATYMYQRFSSGLKINFFSYSKDEIFIKPKFILEKNDLGNKKLFWGLGLDARAWVDLKFSLIPKYSPAGNPNYELSGPSDKMIWFLSIGRNIVL